MAVLGEVHTQVEGAESLLENVRNELMVTSSVRRAMAADT
jgi:hypothetical protein